MLVGVAAWALIWAIRSGQFEDLESQGWSVVLDDDEQPPPGPDSPQKDKGGIHLTALASSRNWSAAMAAPQAEEQGCLAGVADPWVRWAGAAWGEDSPRDPGR